MSEHSQETLLDAGAHLASKPSSKGRILVVDDEVNARQALVALFEDEGFEVRSAPDGFKALGVLREWECDILLTDWRMPVMDGLALLKKAREHDPQLMCIVMTAFASVESAVEALKSGADDYLTKPLNFEAVELVIGRSMERRNMQRELKVLREDRVRTRTPIIGSSPPIQEVVKLAEQVATSRATVLITGKSGTGKELVARLIHDRSTRRDRPFVRLNCASLAESLLESELFGHEKGAFTGANQRREGRFEEADGGTLFLDEVGEIGLSVQVKLLRFLQQREFERVGGNRTISVDVRIIAATNRNLEDEVKSGRFREDLYYRLNVINIKMPALRSRRSDIPLLVRHFATHYAAENEKRITEISPEAMNFLTQYDWPGNVRELENIIERAVVLAEAHKIEAQHLPADFGHTIFTIDGQIQIPGSTLADIEKYALLKTYEATGGNSTETARMLDISVRKVQYRVKEYQG
ncbi:MAG: sigma-54-dependent Fis family transcriptional regulator [Bradymonadaceae bacterium]|nr:sigma-54-dependent Fis family transcriptional regulator [Lujinxingiaceae bacterium]